MAEPPRYVIHLIVLLLFISGCNRTDSRTETVDIDFIKYKVVYLENMAGDIPTRMLPDEMDAYYSKKYVLTKIHGFFGQFSLVQIANLRHNSVTTMLNFFGNKVYYVGDRGEIPAGIAALRNPEITMTVDTLRIGGMLSYRTEISSVDDSYDIFYTKELNIKSPNITTPYYFIDYVLSDFRVQLSILKMRLIMSQHEKTTIENSVFEVPEDYEQVSRETMESIINSLFTKG